MICTLKSHYIRQTKREITDDVLKRAIDNTSNHAFSREQTLISGIEKNIEALPNPKLATYGFNISTGELTFPWERDAGPLKIKMGSVNVYKVLKSTVRIAKGTVKITGGPALVVACAEVTRLQKNARS
jgi:hypothetical protein